MKKFCYLVFMFLLYVSSVYAQNITGVLGAFPPEMVLLESKLKNPKDTVIQRIRFTKGELSGRDVVLAQTGIGKVNAAITTALMIEHFKPREIVFSGIAGGISSSLFPGDIVIGTQVTYHDFGMITDNAMQYWATKNPSTMRENPVYFKCDSALISKAISKAKDLKLEKVKRHNGSFLPAIVKGIIVTGDVFVSSASVTNRLRKDLNAAATEMEGGAIAQACFQQNIPFLIIRSLSDSADNQAQEDMRNFYRVAAANAAMMVIAVVGNE